MEVLARVVYVSILMVVEIFRGHEQVREDENIEKYMVLAFL